MPGKIRRATLVQGGITRLLNTSRELPDNQKNEILTKYMIKLKKSGYDHKTRLEVVESIQNGWEEIIRKDCSGERPLFRNNNYKREERAAEKEMKKQNWFKGKNGDAFDSVIMIPATPNSELKKEVDKIAKNSGLRVKVVERPGKKLIDYLKGFDKTRKLDKCSEPDCLICQTDKGGNCRKPNLVYKITCKECQQNNKKANYYGESNFNGYTRGKQHLENYKSNCQTTQEKSAMRRHAKEVHRDRQVDFEMKLIKTFKDDPLGGQVFESILIVESKKYDDFPLNSKQEFNQALIITAKYQPGVSE